MLFRLSCYINVDTFVCHLGLGYGIQR